MKTNHRLLSHLETIGKWGKDEDHEQLEYDQQEVEVVAIHRLGKSHDGPLLVQLGESRRDTAAEVAHHVDSCQ